MNKYLILVVALLLVINTNAQTLIATTNSPNATANHNQRKIVRNLDDDVFIVFVDTINGENIIKGVIFDRATAQWSNPTFITYGNNPTLSVNHIYTSTINLVYETNDSISKIKHMSSNNFINWFSNHIISDTTLPCKHPISDIDANGFLNVFWIQENNSLNESVVYANIYNESILSRQVITTKTEIKDIAIANHLQYFTNDLFFAIQFNQDSLVFLKTTDNMLTYDSVYKTIGSEPGMTYNSTYSSGSESILRMQYLNINSRLIEIALYPPYNTFNSYQLSTDSVYNICVDNIAPAIGYSYLFMHNGNLYHGFSYAVGFSNTIILDTISGNITNPSIAYKRFNFEFVDFIWMEDNGNGYNIYHKRDEKHIWLGITDNEEEKGFSIEGYPNPFTKKINISVKVKTPNDSPIIKIYNSKSQLIKILKPESSLDGNYSYIWHAIDENNNKISEGIYVIMCTVGNKETARKIVLY